MKLVFRVGACDVFSCMVRPLIATVLFLAALVNSGMIYMFAPEMESS